MTGTRTPPKVVCKKKWTAYPEILLFQSFYSIETKKGEKGWPGYDDLQQSSTREENFLTNAEKSNVCGEKTLVLARIIRHRGWILSICLEFSSYETKKIRKLSWAKRTSSLDSTPYRIFGWSSPVVWSFPTMHVSMHTASTSIGVVYSIVWLHSYSCPDLSGFCAHMCSTYSLLYFCLRFPFSSHSLSSCNCKCNPYSCILCVRVCATNIHNNRHLRFQDMALNSSCLQSWAIFRRKCIKKENGKEIKYQNSLASLRFPAIWSWDQFWEGTKNIVWGTAIFLFNFVQIANARDQLLWHFWTTLQKKNVIQFSPIDPFEIELYEKTKSHFR